jgi:hypothetical protein
MCSRPNAYEIEMVRNTPAWRALPHHVSWSLWTPQQHLDAAGLLFAEHERCAVNGMHKDLIEAQAHALAATVPA